MAHHALGNKRVDFSRMGLWSIERLCQTFFFFLIKLQYIPTCKEKLLPLSPDHLFERRELPSTQILTSSLLLQGSFLITVF